MREVVVLGVGMHPFGKFEDKSVTELCRAAVEQALADAGVAWREVEAVSAASSRFSGGKGWGLNGNDVVEDMGSTGIPVYNLSAGCAAGGNALDIAHKLVASEAHDLVCVVGGEKMPRGFIQTSGVEEETDPEFLRQRCVGMPGPAFWAALCRRRMEDFGTTVEQLAQIAVKAHRVGTHNPNARFRKEFTLEEILGSPMVSDPLHLYEICPVSDGAAAAIVCSAEIARKHTTHQIRLASTAVATARFDDGLPRGLGCVVPPAGGHAHHSEAALAVAKAFANAGVGPGDLDLVELQDNTVYYELAFAEDWGLCKPGEAESLLEAGHTLPTGRLPINPSGGFLCFGEATTAMGLFQLHELTIQLRGEAGPRQVPDARLGLAQTLGLGGNATAAILQR
ncbi:MAG: transporter [Myxococcota bacterium]